MEIYVDELPKSCEDCNIYKLRLGCCLTDFSRTTPKIERHQNCPLHRLADFEKQVRADERKKVYDYFARNVTVERIEGKWYCKHDEIEDVFNELLDQIEGETK